MPDWVVPLSDVRFREEEVAAVADTYRSGWLSQGPKVAAFEAAFAEHLGSRHAVAVASGTAALQLICAGLQLRAGDQVVLPSLTFAATAAAVVHSGAEPVFADIRGASQPWLSSQDVAGVLTERTRAIVNVSYAGHPGQVRELRELASAHGLALIEDAAHALGTEVQGRHAGTFGTAGAFSFFANKNLPLGEGGMVVTDDDVLAARMLLLRSHGLTADTWARHRGTATAYEVMEAGFNFRLDEPRAALGALLLQRLAADNDRRAAIATRYEAELERLEGVRPAIGGEPDARCAWHIYPVLLDAGVERQRFRALLHEAGVQTSVHYPPLHTTSAYRSVTGRPLPSTEDYGRRTVTLPIFPHMSEQQHQRVLDAVAVALQATHDPGD